MKTIRLPREQVRAVKAELRRSLADSDSATSDRLYASYCALHWNPVGAMRGRVVRGTRPLQWCLNMVILCNRLLIICAVLLAAYGLLWRNWVVVLAVVPGILVFALWILNTYVQTSVNLELAARLMVLDRLMESDADFRNQAVAVFKENIEKLEAVRGYDTAKAAGGEAISFEQATNESERDRE